ncbi:MAG: cytochrome ubiquinol oxidase subunit I [Acidobacteriota bacterium]
MNPIPMSPLAAARAQMELSLGFHIIFSAIGMAMPVMMLLAEWRWIRHGDRDARALARTWSRLTAVTFAIGAVSGTALSFELGLLWPGFMAFAGPLIGPAFALEGYAFFLEAIFLGLYLYGWERLTPRVHWLCGCAVAVSGALSGIFVLSTNAWMQDPSGFRLGADGMPTEIDAWAALVNPAWRLMATHSTLAMYQAVGFAAAGTYAWAIWRARRPERARYHAVGLIIAMLTASGAAFAEPLVGDRLAKRLYLRQPVKLAAMEGHFDTSRRAPLHLGGLPDPEARLTRYAVTVPGLLSLLATGDLDAEVLGLDRFPRDEWPNVALTHIAFQIMVAAGTMMIFTALWYWIAIWTRRGRDRPLPRGLLLALIASGPLGLVAVEAGWVLTEAGRQPWVIYKVMRTADAVTPVASVSGSLALFAVLYATLGAMLVFFLWHLAGDRQGPAH